MSPSLVCRWAFKQKTAFLIGQQRESKVVSPEWHVKGLLWPSNENGSWNDELVWPVDGLLLPHVPPIMWPRDTKGWLILTSYLAWKLPYSYLFIYLFTYLLN